MSLFVKQWGVTMYVYELVDTNTLFCPMHSISLGSIVLTYWYNIVQCSTRIGDYQGLLRDIVDYWRLLGLTGGYWRLLEITGGYCRLLETAGDYWGIL